MAKIKYDPIDFYEKKYDFKYYDLDKVYIVNGREIKWKSPILSNGRLGSDLVNNEWYMCADYDIKKQRERKKDLVIKWVVIIGVLFVVYKIATA